MSQNLVNTTDLCFSSRFEIVCCLFNRFSYQCRLTFAIHIFVCKVVRRIPIIEMRGGAMQIFIKNRWHGWQIRWHFSKMMTKKRFPKSPCKFKSFFTNFPISFFEKISDVCAVFVGNSHPCDIDIVKPFCPKVDKNQSILATKLVVLGVGRTFVVFELNKQERTIKANTLSRRALCFTLTDYFVAGKYHASNWNIPTLWNNDSYDFTRNFRWSFHLLTMVLLKTSQRRKNMMQCK